MTPEDYYLEQSEQVHDDVVNLQEKALRLACKECGLTEEIDEFEVISSSDEIAKTAWYKGMYAKRVKFECSELNLTFSMMHMVLQHTLMQAFLRMQIL